MHKQEAIRIARELLANPNAVLLDTETTGLSKQDQVIELAIMGTDGIVILNQRYRPTVPIKADAEKIHGISYHSLIQSPPVHKIEDHALPLLKDRVIVAHNASFDKRMLVATCPNLKGLTWVCSLELYKAAFPEAPNHKLEGDHSAIGDLKALLKLLKDIASLDGAIEPDFIATSHTAPTAAPMIFFYKMIDELAELRETIAMMTSREKELREAVLKMMGDDSTHSSDKYKITKSVSQIIQLKDEVDISSLPSQYHELKLNTKALREDLADGCLIPWIELSSRVSIKLTANSHDKAL